MNLQSLVKLYCGGPGSGRHKGSSVKSLIEQGKIKSRVFYHYTSTENVHKILKEGLKAKSPGIWNQPKGVYLHTPRTLGMNKQKEIAMKERGDKLIKIVLPDHFVLHPDPLRSGLAILYSKESIPPKYLKEWKSNK